MSSTVASAPLKPSAALRRTSRIAALDGWRGIAILLVLFDHIQVALAGRYLRPWMQTGQHGVTTFFVLSGFLITSKLLEAPSDLRRFYVRRFFRLMPAAWTYIGALLFLTYMTRVPFTSWPEVRACVFFYRNFAVIRGYDLAGHFWSLSLEEQFYLLWPCILLFTGARRSRWIAGAGAVAVATFRWLSWSHYNAIAVNGQSQVRADALMVGCLLALLLSESRSRAAVVYWAPRFAALAAATLLFCFARFHWLPPLIENIAIGTLIAACVLDPQSILAQSLSFKPLTWLGIVSYSIYIWQELFVRLDGASLHGRIIAICLIPAFGLGSYYWIERPCIRLGNRITEKFRYAGAGRTLQ